MSWLQALARSGRTRSWASIPSMMSSSILGHPLTKFHCPGALLTSPFTHQLQVCSFKTKSRLGRGLSHRKSMLRNMVSSLFEHEKIKTTLSKAKECARLSDKLITFGKRGTLASRRNAAAYLRSRAMLVKLFTSKLLRHPRTPIQPFPSPLSYVRSPHRVSMRPDAPPFARSTE